MADEPNATIMRERDAHDDNGGQRETSCFSLIGPSIDATLPGNRKVMEAHDADLKEASRGLEPSRASVLAAELQVSASSGALAEQQLSCVAPGADSASDGVDQPADVRLRGASQRRTGGAGDSARSVKLLTDLRIFLRFSHSQVVLRQLPVTSDILFRTLA